MTKLNLEDIMNQMELISDEGNSFLNKATGRLVHVNNAEMRHARDGGDDESMPDWQKENVQIARAVLGNDNFIQLPTEDQIHESDLVEAFCLSLADDHIRSEVINSFKQEPGVSRPFRDLLFTLRLGEDWYMFKREAYRRVAVEWCERNHFEYI